VKVSQVNIIDSLSNTTFEAPSLNTLMQFHTRQDFDATQNISTEQVSLTGFIPLPPFLFSDISAIQHLDAYSIFTEAKSSVNSWVASFNVETNQAILDRQIEFKRLLQWLWAVNQELIIPVSPIQPVPGPLEQQWKSDLHQLHIQHTAQPGVNHTAPAHPQGISVSAPPELTLAMAKMQMLSSRSTVRTPGRKNSRNRAGPVSHRAPSP